MAEPREFDCIDCGTHVYSYATHAANDQAICFTCQFLRGVDDPVERDKLRATLHCPLTGEDNL